MHFEGLPQGRQGLQGGVGGRCRRRSASSWTSSSRCTRSGRPDATPAAMSGDELPRRSRRRARSPARSRSSASRTSASRRSSTGSRRAAPPSCTRRRASRATARSCSASGAASGSGSSTRAASTRSTAARSARKIAEQARAAIDEADLVLFVVDARAGITPGDEELAEILRARASAGDRAREQDRRPAPRPRRARLPPARARRPVPALGAARPRHRRPARRDRRAASRHERGRDRRGGDPRRDPRPAERRQVVAAERAPRPGARDRLGGPGHDAGRDRHGARSAATRRSCSSTRRACAASASTGRESSTTRELRALEAAERADVALVLVRRVGGDRRAGSRRRRRRAQGGLRDARRAVEVGRDGARHRRGAGPPRAAAAPAPAGDRRLGEDRPRASTACSTRSRSSSRSTTAGSRPASSTAPSASCEDARPGPQGERGRRLKLMYGTQVSTRPPRFRIFVNDAEPRHARLRLLGRERAPRAVRARRRARVDRLREGASSAGAGHGRRRRLVGNGVRGAPARPRPRRDARLPRRGAGRGDRGDRPQSALPLARRPARDRRDDDRGRPGRRCRARRRRGAERGVRRGRRRAPRHRPCSA